MSNLIERLRHQWGWENSAASLRLEAANRIAELEFQMSTAVRVIEGLADQQAIPNDWYADDLEGIRAALEETNDK